MGFFGRLFFGGNRGADNEQIRIVREEAERGDAIAQYKLAICYATGHDGVAKDPEGAAKWYRKAAEQGHSEAQFIIATC
jgi:TPR repeat protein